MTLTERFTRLDEETLEYKFTVDDPDTYDVPWTAVMQMVKTDADVYEFACHEGNYAMPLMLKGARKAGEMVPAKKMTHGFQVGASLGPKGLVCSDGHRWTSSFLGHG